MEKQTPTTRELFETVRDHLLTQKAQSLNAGGKCAYRGSDGLKCAIGVLISDEYYLPKLDDEELDMSVAADPVRRAVASSIARDLDADDIHLLLSLQHMHDFTDPADWAHDLAAIARRRT